MPIVIKPKMSKIIYENARYVEKKLSSSALGDNLLRFYEMSGIVQIDLYKQVFFTKFHHSPSF